MKLITLFPILLSMAVHQGSGEEFDKSFVGVSFSPYVKEWENGKTPPWNSYTFDEITEMLNVTSTKFQMISTYSMGVGGQHLELPWYQADVNCLIPRAAAKLNKDDNQTVISVYQGVYQNKKTEIQKKEIDNAFLAAKEANEIFPGTVKGITFFNHYIVNVQTATEVNSLLKEYKQKGKEIGVKVGTRIHNFEKYQDEQTTPEYIYELAKESDYIICIIFPTRDVTLKGVDTAIEEIGAAYLKAARNLRNKNPNLELILGDFGWPSKGRSHNQSPNNIENQRDFWYGMGKWALVNQEKIFLFEALDEPWKSDVNDRDTNNPGGRYGAEAHYGWWRKLSTGEFVEKINDPLSYLEAPQHNETGNFWEFKIPPKTQKIRISFA